MPEEYEKTVWHAGDIVTAEKMNKIEEQLEYISVNGATAATKKKVVILETTVPNWNYSEPSNT